jgi:hypothetical protein
MSKCIFYLPLPPPPSYFLTHLPPFTCTTATSLIYAQLICHQAPVAFASTAGYSPPYHVDFDYKDDILVMSSCRPPSRLHQSRCKYWGNVYGETDSGNNDNNNNDDNGDDDNVPAADNSDDNDDEDDNNTDAPVPHLAAAASLPLTYSFPIPLLLLHRPSPPSLM